MKITNRYNLPQPLVDAVKNDEYDPGNADYTASQLPEPPQLTILRNRYKDEIVEDVTDRIYMLMGKAIHNVLEKYEDKDALQEERLEADFYIDGEERDITAGGKQDIYKDGKISDYKVTSAYSILFSSRIKQWTEQLNVYAYLFRAHGFEVKELEIVAILRDWNRTQSLRSQDYPDRNVVVLPIELWSYEQQESYITERVRLLKENESKPDSELTPCTEEEVWARPTTYAVMKEGRKTAVKLFDNLADANNLIAEKGGRHYLEVREGEWTRCKSYCPVARFCHQYTGEIDE